MCPRNQADQRRDQIRRCTEIPEGVGLIHGSFDSKERLHQIRRCRRIHEVHWHRERVEKLKGSGPPTESQRTFIENLLQDFPDTRDMDEYEDYCTIPTSGSASTLISAALDANAHEVVGREGYMKYIATRPRVDRRGEHGLFSNRPVSLDASLKEVEEHSGNVWTFIWSLRREDAARLGYDHAESWQKLIKAHQVEIAGAMKIPPDQLRWCAAFHDEGEHPHVHAIVWSADPKRGHLTKEGINAIRSKLTNDIFQDELYSLYQEKDISYKELVSTTRQSMRDLIAKMQETVCDCPVIGAKMLALSQSLETATGKKVYGYLKKATKAQVDDIVDELSKISAVAECYAAWNKLRDELESYYNDTPRQHLPRSQQKEFRAIKNLVIQEAEHLRRNVFTFEDVDMVEKYTDVPPANSDHNAVLDYYHAVEVLDADNVTQAIEKIGYMQARQNGLTIFVEKSPAAIAVSESVLVPKGLSYQLISYNHYSMKGQLEAKKNTLIQLAALLEPKRGDIKMADKMLEKDLFYLFNNLNIRHNNVEPTDSGKYKPFVAQMKSEELEHWYDETYQMCLLAFLQLEHLERKVGLDKLKTEILK